MTPGIWFQSRDTRLSARSIFSVSRVVSRGVAENSSPNGVMTPVLNVESASSRCRASAAWLLKESTDLSAWNSLAKLLYFISMRETHFPKSILDYRKYKIEKEMSQ